MTRHFEYQRVQRQGRRYHSAHFVIFLATAGEDASPRVGITVSRRVGAAVVRNKVKRQVRECFRRELKGLLRAGSELVVIARPGAAGLPTPTVNDELRAATLILTRRPNFP